MSVGDEVEEWGSGWLLKTVSAMTSSVTRLAPSCATPLRVGYTSSHKLEISSWLELQIVSASGALKRPPESVSALRQRAFGI